MNLPPRDYTEQEQIIARCLDEFGLRYEQQAYYHPYIIDFYIPEIKMAVEADGVYGHLSKRDRKRDKDLLSLEDIEYIIHIKETTLEKIRESLWQELTKLDP
jgi:very-short-patch-repair endonuclease|tara:strand:+ start:429 stop:734 length:306 start_codon:yes stop_codon:yes gene_type:complete